MREVFSFKRPNVWIVVLLSWLSYRKIIKNELPSILTNSIPLNINKKQLKQADTERCKSRCSVTNRIFGKGYTDYLVDVCITFLGNFSWMDELFNLAFII